MDINVTTRIARLFSVLALGLFSQAVAAGWTAPAKVASINIGANSYHATNIQLEGVSFTGCTSTSSAVMTPDNLNYRDMLAALMAAKLAQSEVKVLYSGCQWGYAVIRERVL